MPTDPPANVNPDGIAGLFGWREIVLALAVLLGVYVALAFFRLRRLGRPPADAEKPVDKAPAGAGAADPVAAQPAWGTAREVPLDSYDANLPWVKGPAHGADQRRLEIIEREIISMRDQLDGLREAVTALADELRGAIELGAVQPKAPHQLSPLYGDAMQMAMAGHDAATISERCGIARAEAELVVALAQQSRQADQGENDGRQDRY